MLVTPGCTPENTPVMIMKAIVTMMTTMLLTTGVHIGAAKWPRAFRTAPASELTP